MRITCCIAVALVAVGAATLTSAEDAKPSADVIRFDIKPQALAPALNALALQAHQQILFTPEAAAGKTTQGVEGDLTAEEALTKVLAGTGLSYSKSAGMILVAQAEGAGKRPLDGAGGEGNGTSEVQGQATEKVELTEIVVTAQKRKEILRDVPVPVTVVEATTLQKSNQTSFKDFYTRFPGVSVDPEGGSVISQQIAIRGITTGVGFSNPTVSVLLDDVALGASTALGGGLVLPELDPGEISQIEVLRGPQGTLYGASGLGGAIKYTTADPSPDSLRGRLQLGIGGIAHGEDTAHNIRGVANIPIGQNFAVLASAFSALDPGYMDVIYRDDVSNGRRDVNTRRSYGGRISALWRPSDDISLKLSALYQKNKLGTGTVDTSIGDYSNLLLRDTERASSEVQSYTANLDLRIGSIRLSSITGYSKTQGRDDFDLGGIIPFFSGVAFAGYGVTGVRGPEDLSTDKFTQEIRATTDLGSFAHLLLGGYYQHEDSLFYQTLPATDPLTGNIAGYLIYHDSIPTTYGEVAAFGNITFDLTSKLDLQMGARASNIDQSYQEDTLAMPVLGGHTTVPEIKIHDSSFTGLFTPRYKVSESAIVYARLASGYRPGGPNPAALLSSAIPSKFSPDKTTNYELGAKGRLLGGLLNYDVSVFHISWDHIQLRLIDLTTFRGYGDNGGRAKSNGVEVTLEVHPRAGLTISGWGSWGSAKLTSDFPANSTAVGKSGERLPLGPEFSGHISLDQEFTFGSNFAAVLGASVAYVGERAGAFKAAASARQPNLPQYTKLDLRAGVRREEWSLDAYVNNLADKKGIFAGDPASDHLFRYITPRTYGLTLTRTF